MTIASEAGAQAWRQAASRACIEFATQTAVYTLHTVWVLLCGFDPNPQPEPEAVWSPHGVECRGSDEARASLQSR